MWERVTTPKGVNYELRPWLRMTVPRKLKGATLKDVPVGVVLGRSWVFFGGVVPFDYDDLMLAEVGPGYRFLERSRTFSAAMWQHERVVSPVGEGSSITDIVTFEPRALIGRLPFGRRLMRAIVTAIFRHRHRRLVRYFGTA